ncbi:MAG TPA: trans-aconitate 2-methyltransferase [Roseiarcus sp.]
MSWSATQYVKFEQERTRPVRDLVARIPDAEVLNAADIGCGPGNSTEVLRERYPHALIVGIDSSPDMIEAARKRLPDIAFEVADIRHWRPEEPLDLILANASLQWIPGHETLLPALIGALKPGGALAVQMPDNLDEDSHRLMREIAAEGSWAAKLRDAAKARAERHGAEWYFRLARPHASSVDVWRTTYFHPLAGPRAIVEWLKGSGLRPFLDPLEESEREAFLACYEEEIAKAYPAEPDGTVLLPFPRLFFVAAR